MEKGSESTIERMMMEGQGHLFSGWDKRKAEMKRRLLQDLESLDSDILEEAKSALARKKKAVPSFAPTPYIRLRDPIRTEEAAREGESLVATGKTCFLTVAGGQGSRLGFDGPKGMFPISPIREATLFQIFAEKLLAAVKRYGAPIPWYIMTSQLNHDATVSAFRQNDYFGLDETGVRFFPQGVLPTFDSEGRLLLSTTGGLLANPDGHGGVIKALKRHGLLEEMRKRGIEEIFYFQVDNPLVVVPDPLFLGVHRRERSQVSSKVIAKSHPEEKLGVIGLIDGSKGVIEYSDLDRQSMYAKNQEGELLYSQGSIAIHIFNVEFLASETIRLPYHRARKKVKTLIPEDGKTEVVEREGVKLEMFIFDVIPMADRAIFYETSREEEFAPLKNREGDDSIETCIGGQIMKAAIQLEAAGVVVPRDEKGRPKHRIEISPLFALDLEELKEKLAENPTQIEGDRLFE
jgi:UDP-N-acetylglucosamine/UDP-N-acetylgalactosamine diphosphorylase